ncbi:MAG: efflux RND transporter periplasmic adaptor subunit, partial [Planctomycetota bacterium]
RGAAAGPRRWRRRMPLLGIAAAGAVAVYAAYRLFSGGSLGDGVFGGELTYRVVRGDLRVSFTERGEIKAAKSVEVISQVEGLSRIVSVVPEGTYVEAGDTLVELDSSELTQAINQQQIAVETAESNYLQAQKQVEIQKSLNASSLDQARLDLELAKIDLEKYTGEKDLGLKPWNPLPLLREDETLLADATDRTADEIRAALEKAERVVELERPDGGDGGAAAPAAEATSGDPATASRGGALAAPEDPSGDPPGGGPEPGTGIAALAPAAGGETSPAVPSAERLPGSPAGGESAGAIDPGRKLRTGDFLLAYKKAIADVKIASAEVARAKNQWEWTARLAEKGYVTGTELTADTLSLQKAELAKQQAQGSLELFLTYTWRKEYAKYRSAVEQTIAAFERAEQKAAAQLAQAEADLRAKEATYSLSKKRLEKLKDQLEKTKIRAPASGMVVYVQERRFGGREQIIEPGAEVRENQLLMRLPDVATMAVSVDVHESWIDQVREGTPAFVSIDALPNLKLRGRVTKIGILPDSVNRWLNPDLKVYQTEVTIEDCPEVKLLRPGMSAKVEVVTAILKDVVFVPLQSVTAVDREQVCYALEGGKFVPRPVQGGRHNESFIEIVSGLSEGEIVQLNPPAPKESGRERPAEADEVFGAEAPEAAAERVVALAGEQGRH